VIRVEATSLGTYASIRRREGNVFTIKNEKEFSHKWMKKVPMSTPETPPSAVGPIKEGNVPSFEHPDPNKREPVALSQVGKKKASAKKGGDKGKGGKGKGGKGKGAAKGKK